MSEPRKEAFLLNEMSSADASDYREVIAQWLAAIAVSAGFSLRQLWEECDMIPWRIVDLMENESLIWTELLPGGPGPAPKWEVVDVTDDEQITAIVMNMLQKKHDAGDLPADLAKLVEHLANPQHVVSDDQFTHHVTFWRGEDRLGEDKVAEESVLNLAGWVFGELNRYIQHDYPNGGQIDASKYKAWIRPSIGGQTFMMTWPKAQLILQMNSLQETFSENYGANAEAIHPDLFQTISDEMGHLGDQWADGLEIES